MREGIIVIIDGVLNPLIVRKTVNFFSYDMAMIAVVTSPQVP